MSRRAADLFLPAVAFAVLTAFVNGQERPSSTQLPPIPSQPRGAFVGTAGDVLLAAGGADARNEPLAEIWAYDDTWRPVGRLAVPRSHGACVSCTSGVVLIGGRDARGPRGDVSLVRWDAAAARATIEPLPALPIVRDAPAWTAAAIGERVYVVASGGGRTDLRSLDLAATGTDRVWIQRESPPGAATRGAFAVAQSRGGAERAVYLFGGARPRQVLRFDPHPGRWTQLADAPVALDRGAALGPAHVLVTAGTPPDRLFALHTITERWVDFGSPAGPLPSTTAVSWRDGVAWFGGDRDVWICPAPRTSGFASLDYAVLFGYLALLVAMGFYFSRRERGTDDYFLAGRRIPWWAAGLSIYATQLSAITFLSTPALAFATNWLVFPGMIVILVMAPVVARYFLPFYRRLGVTTAYEYLERRFHVAVRLFGSASFVVFQFGRMAVVVYLPALALAAITGFDVATCILLMGILATLYTVLGGMEAVIWTDVLQALVLVGGLGAALIVALAHEGLAATWQTALDDDKLSVLRWNGSLTELATWSIVLGSVLLQLGPYTTDQAVIQRYLTTRDERGAARGILLNGLLSVPFGLLFFALGTCLYAFYKSRPELLPLGMKNDEVLPLFVAQQLPVGLSGLVIAGVFAASMSSLDSSMHSIATAVTTDFYRRFRPNADDRRALRVARTLTVVAGAAGTGLALLLATFDIQSLFLFFQGLLGLLTSGLVALFLLGMFTERANAAGALTGAAVGITSLFFVSRTTDLHFYLYPVVGIGVSVAVGYGASLVLGRRPESIDGLTWRTLARVD